MSPSTIQKLRGLHEIQEHVKTDQNPKLMQAKSCEGLNKNDLIPQNQTTPVNHPTKTLIQSRKAPISGSPISKIFERTSPKNKISPHGINKKPQNAECKIKNAHCMVVSSKQHHACPRQQVYTQRNLQTNQDPSRDQQETPKC